MLCVVMVCSSTAPAIVVWNSLILPITETICVMDSPASPASIWIASIRREMSSAARRVSCASCLTSSATAKPLPASPARAATMVALSASRLVCSAMAVISRTTSPISRLDSPSLVMVWVVEPTAVTAAWSSSSTASLAALDRAAELIDRALVGIEDPAERVAVGLRLLGRLGCAHPQLANALIETCLDILDVPTGLAPRALRDVQAGQAVGRFTIADADVALGAATGRLLWLFRRRLRHPQRVDETAIDQFTEASLGMLGAPADDAARLVATQLPTTGPWLAADI